MKGHVAMGTAGSEWMFERRKNSAPWLKPAENESVLVELLDNGELHEGIYGFFVAFLLRLVATGEFRRIRLSAAPGNKALDYLASFGDLVGVQLILTKRGSGSNTRYEFRLPKQDSVSSESEGAAQIAA